MRELFEVKAWIYRQVNNGFYMVIVSDAGKINIVIKHAKYIKEWQTG
jgi:predicted transcriptional regulator of viral defense system